MLELFKLQGAGNDYVYLDGLRQQLPSDQTILAEWARVLSDRHYGVGGDGLILILPGLRHDFRMRMFNSDGTEGRMCGNGMRCVAKYLWDAGHTCKKELCVETLAGLICSSLTVEDGAVVSVRVDMGEPGLTRGSLPVQGPAGARAERLTFKLDDGMTLVGTGVSMGNAHTVFFVDEVEKVPLERWGPLIEWDRRFPERTNVEFVQVLGPGRLRMRVWERGSGVTMACGTGACASLVAAERVLGFGRKASVVLDGGTLSVEWDAGSNHVYMTGPAELVFRGTCDIAALVGAARKRAAAHGAERQGG